MQYAIGIDPGLHGGLAMLNKGLDIVTFHAMPVKDKDVDSNSMWDWLLELMMTIMASGTPAHEVRVFLEKQQIRSNQKGAMRIGANYGRIIAVLEFLDLDVTEVTPQAWKSSVLKNVDSKKTGEKNRSVAYCLEMEYELPTLNPNGKKLHDGIADAVCIALYGWKVDSDS
jgi:Holliday junction resolvasome RuvABC endonuclease subunit